MCPHRTNSSDSGGYNSKTEHPGSATDRPSPGVLEVAPSDSAVFPLSLLPAELRLQIFEFFALPKIPFVFSIGNYYCRVVLGGELWGDANVYTCVYREEFWSLRQVNREARQAVLRGRQAVYDCRGAEVEGLEPITFVKWSHDLVHFGGEPSGLDVTLPTWKASIQNIVYYLAFTRHDQFLLHGYPIDLIIADLPSLSCVCFMIDFVQVPQDWKGYKFSIGRLVDYYGEGYEPEIGPTVTRPIAGNAPTTLRGDSGGFPVSVETMMSHCPGDPEEGFVEWCEEFAQRLDRFQVSMQHSISRKLGRPIKCKTIMKEPKIK